MGLPSIPPKGGGAVWCSQELSVKNRFVSYRDHLHNGDKLPNISTLARSRQATGLYNT